MSATGLWRDTSGATALEFALIAPLLFLLLFGAVEAGRLLFAQSALHHSVSAAARCAGIDAALCGTPAALSAKVEDGMAALSASSATEPAELVMSAAPCGLSIAIKARYRPLLLQLSAARPTLHAEACVRP